MTPLFEQPTPGYIRKFADDVAAQVAIDYTGNPLGELTVWLQMALRREASVSQVYDVGNLERRLALVRCPREHIDLLHRVFSNIWAQEKAHAAYLESMLSGVVRRAGLLPWLTSRVDAVLGGLEGQLLSARTSPGLSQRLKSAVMLACGNLVQDVPEFVGDLEALSFRDFCLLNAELEITAIHGYQRMLVLLEALDGHPLALDTTFATDLEHFVRDEQFHNQTFLAMDSWFSPARPALEGRARQPFQGSDLVMLPRLSTADCRAQLALIREAVYGAPKRRSRSRKPRQTAKKPTLSVVLNGAPTPKPAAPEVRRRSSPRAR